MSRSAIVGWALAGGMVLPVVLAAERESAATSAAAEYRARADELEAYLDRNVLAVRFPGAVDEHGGFHVSHRRDWSRLPDQDRFVVFEARLTWTAARVALDRPARRDEYLAYVRHGVAYLRDAYWDREQGGFRSYVRVSGAGEAADSATKLAYGNAFAVYALAAAYDATRDPETLALAQRGFRWMEDHLREEGKPGYVAAVSRDGKPLPFSLDDPRPPLQAMGAPAAYRSMNPHIHILEAYAELLRVWPDPVLRQRTREMLELVRDRFFTEPGCLHLYLLPDGRPVPGPVSFGHDIETAFLLIEAAEALGEAEDPRTGRAARMLVDHTLAYGWNAETGQLYDRGWAFEPAFDRSVQWWALFEAFNAMLLMHERHGSETPAYREAFEKTWRFTRDTLTDTEHGGVYLGIDEHGRVNTEKTGNWFASYHQARALLLSAQRLRRLASAPAPWALGPFRKESAGEPILAPSAEGSFACPVRRAPVRWEELALYNPAAVVRDGQVHLLYRAQDKDGTSRLGLAQSPDGVRFTRRKEPVLYPAEDARKADEWPGGCEDPRLVEDDRGRYVLTYTAYDGKTARLAVATSKDLVRWTKHGLAFGPKHRDLWSKSGAIVCRWRGARCVAERVGGRYWMFWGDTSLFAATSNDLVGWTPLLGGDGKPAPVMAPRPGRFDSELVEPGPAPFLTPAGIVLLYNARNAAGATRDPSLTAGAYAPGQALFDAKDPRRVLARSDQPFLRPDLGHEQEGQVANVVFVEGLVPLGGRYWLYFGAADSRLSVASAPIP